MRRVGTLKYIAKRLAILPIQLLGLTVVVFVLIRLLPTDPAVRKLGILATPEAYAFARHELGLDAPIWVQLARFIADLAHGSLGVSWETSDPVTVEIADRIPITLQVMVFSFLIALAVGMLLGTLAAFRPGGRADRTVFVYSLFAGAQPEFWWGLMFIFVFAAKLRILPVPIGLLDPNIIPPPTVTHFILIDSVLSGRLDALASALSYFTLPAITLAFVLTGPIVKMTRQTLVRVLRSDFILHERARGLPLQQVARHALRNSLPPVVTLVGILFGFLLGGAVLIEYIFSLNGVGQYALQRTLALDYPAMQGVVLVLAAFSLAAYLVIDVLYTVIDPRIEL